MSYLKERSFKACIFYTSNDLRAGNGTFDYSFSVDSRKTRLVICAECSEVRNSLVYPKVLSGSS